MISDSGPWEDVIEVRGGGFVARQWLHGEVVATAWGAQRRKAEDDARTASGHACWNMAEREAEMERAFAEQEAQRFAQLVRRQGGPV